MINPQDLDCRSLKPIGHDVGCPRDDKFARARHTSGAADPRIVGEQLLDALYDVLHGPAGGSRIVFRNIGTQRNQVFDSLRRPSDLHFADRLGAGRSRLPLQELTHALTCSCGMLSPRSSEAMAFLTPATCHSLTSRYSFSASAARNDRLRPVLLASFSSRLLTSVSTRTVKVVEDIAS